LIVFAEISIIHHFILLIMALLLHVLMLVLLSGGSAEVVENFEWECGEFFANGKSPTRFSGLQYKQICQTRNGVHYATYYDTDNKIPVYSAYRFRGLQSCKRKNWYIEPQVSENIILLRNMTKLNKHTKQWKIQIITESDKCLFKTEIDHKPWYKSE